MRLFPILAAVVMAVLVYALIFEHEWLNAQFAQDPATQQNAAQTEPDMPATPSKVHDGVVHVVAVKSAARSVDSAVVLRGQTEADRQVELRAETSGQIVSEPLRKGAFVDKGQLLCALDPATRAVTLAEAQAHLAEALARVPEAEAQIPESKARVEEAEARVTEAEARLEEARINSNAAVELSKEGYASETRVASTAASVRGAEAAIISAKAGLKSALSGLEAGTAGIESAKAGVESARSAVATAEKEIDRLSITAPFAGLLESDTAELGSLLQLGSLCATVVQLNPVMLVGFVSETQVNRVEMGALAKAELASGERVQGHVTFVSRVADSATRTFRVEIKVANPDLKLRDGQTAEIVIAADGTKAHLLPQSALTLNNEGALGVRIVAADSTAEFRAVTLLRDTPNGVWLSGLPDTVKVIIVGQEFVIDGVRVAASFQEVGQ